MAGGIVDINALPDSGSLTGTDSLFATGSQATGLLTKSTPAEVQALILASAAIDSVYGTAVGGVLVRGTVGWESLVPGAVGEFLSSGTGSIVTPLWQTLAAGGELVIDQGTLSVPTETLTLTGGGATLSSGGSNQATIDFSGGGGGGSLVLEQGTTTISGVGTLVIGTGITLTGGGATGTLTATGAGFPQDLYSYSSGSMTANQVLLEIDCLRALTFPANFSGSTIKLDTAATASTTLTVSNNGTSIGTATFAASSNVATFSASALTTAAHDSFKIIGPPTPDATAAGVRIAVTGTR